MNWLKYTDIGKIYVNSHAIGTIITAAILLVWFVCKLLGV